MNKLLIKNVGPIGDAFDDSYIEINSLTIFLGPQGSGKSTIAKIYSSLVWLEKALVREEYTSEQYEDKEFFYKEVIAYQGIQSYFKSDSYIHYVGAAFEFKLENGKFSVIACADNKKYKMPKIMYVPAERNFLTSIPKPEYINGLPKPLMSFLSEFDDAKRWITEHGRIKLPVGEVSYQYDKGDKAYYLTGKDYKTELLHGSSGYQSLVPLFVVTEYLSNLVRFKLDDPSREFYSLVLRKNIQNKLARIFENLSKNKQQDKVFDLLKDKVSDTIELFVYKSFINIVEEPEQNLYPDSQKAVLYNLIANLNKMETNQLIITSHSPYMLNFVTLATVAEQLYKKDLSPEDKKDLINIIPKGSCIDLNKVNVYELDKNGVAKILDKSNGYLDDTHRLNSMFEDINENLSIMLDME